MDYSVPDSNLVEEDEPITSTSIQTYKIPQNQNLDEDEQLLDLLWNQGPVVRTLSSNEESNQQLCIEEDEMATWLHHYQAAVNESTNGMADLLSELVEPSCKDSNDHDKEKEDKDDVRTLEDKLLNEVEMKIGNESDSVGCSVHMNINEKKRKERAGKDIECHYEEVEVERGKKRKEVFQPIPLQTRAAEVHNMSERRRRDRINEKMKTLQELVPRCNKTDKASMLDDAIEYLKSLQLQVQMMSSMQYNMGRMMLFPDTHRYMGYIRMGMPTGTMQRPMMPLGSMLPYPMMMAPPHANIQSQLNPSFHQGVVASVPDPRPEASNKQAQIPDPTAMASSSVMPMPNTTDSCHYFAGFHFGQLPSQSPATIQPPAEPRPMENDASTKRPTKVGKADNI